MLALRAALVLAVAFALAPIAGLLVAVPPAAAWSAVQAPETREAVAVSLSASAIAVALAALLGIPAGYLAARTSRVLRGILLFVFALPIALPPVASGIALLGIFGHRQPIGGWLGAHGVTVVDTFAGVVIAEFYVAGSLVAIASVAAFTAIDPMLEDAARTLGAGRLRAFLTIAVPVAAPGLLAGVLLAWLRALGEYGATAMLAYHPASLSIALATSLSADGVPRALALTEAFVALTALVVLAGSLVQRPSR